MRLTTKSRYGTRLLLDLAEHGNEKYVSLSEVSKRQNISVKYLEQLVSKLKRGGFVKSQRGPRGGHRLARPAGEIGVGDIVRILEGTSAITDCSEADQKRCSACSRADDCLTRWVWVEASKAMFKRLDQITVEDLQQSHDNQKAFEECSLTIQNSKLFPAAEEPSFEGIAGKAG